MGPRQRYMAKRAKTHVAPIIVASIFGFMLIAGIAFGVGMLGNVSRWLSDLPDYTDSNEYLVSEPTHILDANGNEIATFFVQNRQSIDRDQVSPYVLKGTVDVEDERFYEHNGVDIIGIGRAIVAQLTGRSEGASTITQQLVRNTILSEEQFDQTIERKVREAWIAIKMEEMFSKDEILMMYLNTIYYGHGAYGIQAASKTYFSKNASDLTLAEAALLIGLPNSPSYYDPTVNPEGAVDRRNKVLDNMLRLGSITQEEHDAAQAEPLTLAVTETSDSGVSVYSQPYFVDYVKTLLQEEFSTDVLFKGGLTVKTTIDPTIQQAAEDAAVGQFNKLRRTDGLDIGMTVIDPKTGYIKAMVGGSDYNRDDRHINHATTQQQPGSAFKAFTLATAIKMGMDPDGVRINCSSRLTWRGADNGDDYTVQNYGGTGYGTLSLRDATAVSSNTGYVQVAETIGNQNIFATCRSLGIDTSEMVDGLASTLGTGYVTTVKMAEAYATFANGGYHREAVAITEIDSRDGAVLYQHQDKPEQVLTAGEAAAVTDVLESVMTGRGTGRTGKPRINQPVAGKTGSAGTATDTTALWFCGYTPQYSVAINMSAYGGGIAKIRTTNSAITLPIFKKFMQTVLADTPREEFPTGEEPNYKDNKEWKFSKTNGKIERPQAQQQEEEKEEKDEQPQEQEQQPAEQAPTEQHPATPEQPSTSTTPESNNNSNSGGNSTNSNGGNNSAETPTTPTTPETGGEGGSTTTTPTTPEAQRKESGE